MATTANKPTEVPHHRTLTSGRTLARSTLQNLVGQMLPVAVGVFAIPPVLHALGKDRFALLTIAWASLNYFTLFDAGIGRATTQLVGELLGSGRRNEIARLAATSFRLTVLLGSIGGLLLASLSSVLATRVLRVPPELQREALLSFVLIGAAVPLVVLQSAMVGFLSSFQRFDLINFVRVPVGILTFAGPLAMIPFTRHLAVFIGIFVFGRFAGAIVQFMMCAHVFPELRGAPYDRSCVRPLLARGGWMTISSVISGVMVYLDRFLIGAYVSLTAVAYYTTPQEIIARAWVLPAALVATLFPAFSVERGAQNGRAALLFERGIRYLFIVLFPCMLIIVIWAPELLRVWLGNDFADHAATPLRWFAGGVLVNSLAQVAFAQVQGAGRPDITAKLHMLELPFYVAGLFWAVRVAGINGAAAVWFFRVALDMLGLFLASSRLLHEGWAVTARLIATVMTGLAVLLASVLLPPHFKVPATVIALLVFTLITWTVLLANSDRGAVRQALKQTSL